MNPLPLKFHRTLLVVSNMTKSISFYRDIVGLREIRDVLRSGTSYDEITGIKNVKLRVAFLEAAGGGLIELVQFVELPGEGRAIPGTQVGATRLCFSISNMGDVVEKLRSRGAPKMRGPLSLQREGRTVAYLLYLEDPDGFEIEFIELVGT